MVIDRHRHHLFSLLLPYDRLVQLLLDQMGGRDILDRVGPGLLFLLLRPLLLGPRHIRAQEAGDIANVQVHERDPGKLPYIHPALAQGVKSLLHAVMAHADLPGHLHHLSCPALRAAADAADLLIAVLLAVLYIRSAPCPSCALIFQYVLSIVQCDLLILMSPADFPVLNALLEHIIKDFRSRYKWQHTRSCIFYPLSIPSASLR